MFSIRNTVIVALMQIGVIVAGVLAAGIWHKLSTSDGLNMPAKAAILYNHGAIGFLIPIIWAAFTLILLNRPEIADEIKASSFWFGVFLLLLLIGFVWQADVAPFFNLDTGMSGGND
jgi:hypothetical protein